MRTPHSMRRSQRSRFCECGHGAGAVLATLCGWQVRGLRQADREVRALLVLSGEACGAGEALVERTESGMNAKHYMGEDERDELTEPDPHPCPDCGAGWDDPCEPTCQCYYCRKRLLSAETEAAVPVGIGRGEQ